jgi:hypothetical protein
MVKDNVNHQQLTYKIMQAPRKQTQKINQSR